MNPESLEVLLYKRKVVTGCLVLLMVVVVYGLLQAYSFQSKTTGLESQSLSNKSISELNL